MKILNVSVIKTWPIQPYKNIFGQMSGEHLLIHKTLLQHFRMSSGALRKRSRFFWVELAVFCPYRQSGLSCFFVHHSYCYYNITITVLSGWYPTRLGGLEVYLVE